MSDEERVEEYSSKAPDSLKQIEQEKQTEANCYFSNLTQGEEIDESCIHVINKRLVRIQYPGIVKNLDKALDTLGCISGIEKAVSSNRLELNFHPKNRYNKGVIADHNANSGILVKVIKQQRGNEAPVWKYEIIGATVKNFVFSKFIDFQYLPLVAEYPENHDSTAHFVYDSILPDKLPELDSVLKDEKMSMPLFLPPAGYSRSDIQKKINPVAKQPSDENTDSRVLLKKRGRKLMAFSRQKQPSIFHKFIEPEIPEKPTEFISQLVGRRNYHDHLIKLQELFKGRPIWTKNGLKYNSHFSNDLLKVLLPAVAYYELTGPWRCTWIRFGYDPRKDPEAKKYQNLDYRIPFSVRANLKIGSKRVTEAKALPSSLEKLDAENKSNKYVVYQENSYILRPDILPTARQVFYQYCDILLPEIQTMLSRLPPPTPETKCDPKNGWFPSSFIDQCREVVNKYIDQQAAKVLRKKRESLPPNPVEELFNRTNKLLEQKNYGDMKQEMKAGPSTSSDDFDALTIYDSDESITECEKFYQENDLYDLADELDDSITNSSDSQIITATTLEELNEIMKVRRKPQ